MSVCASACWRGNEPMVVKGKGQCSTLHPLSAALQPVPLRCRAQCRCYCRCCASSWYQRVHILCRPAPHHPVPHEAPVHRRPAFPHLAAARRLLVTVDGPSGLNSSDPLLRTVDSRPVRCGAGVQRVRLRRAASATCLGDSARQGRGRRGARRLGKGRWTSGGGEAAVLARAAVVSPSPSECAALFLRCWGEDCLGRCSAAAVDQAAAERSSSASA